MISLGRLYFTDPYGFWVDAYLFDTKAEMHDYIVEVAQEHNDCEAMCIGLRKRNGRGNLTKQLGTLVFYREFMGGGIVSHEASHAAFNWMREKYPKFTLASIDSLVSSLPEDHPEEEYCLVQGNIVSQFWNNYYERLEVHEA